MTRSVRTARAPGTAGMLLVIVGAATVLIAIAGLGWYDVGGGTDAVSTIGFRDLADTAGRLDVPGLVPSYFHWLAWVLLIVLIAVGVLANAPSRASTALRLIGLVIGLAGTAVTYFALQEIKSYGANGTDALHRADAGVWCALAGFLAAGIGAAIGPRRV